MKKLISTIVVITLLIAITAIVAKNRPKEERVIVMPIDKKTALFLSGSKDKIRKYLESPKATVRSYDYYLIIVNDRLDILEMILKDFDDPNDLKGNDSPLLDAVEELKPKAVELLIKYGADVNDKDSFGNTPLILAAKAAFVIPEYKIKSREISKMLIDAGADVNAVGQWFTPLDAALSSKDMKNAKYIVNHGANIHYLDADGSSYMFSCFSLECILYLHEKGLDINAIDNDETNVLQNSITGRIPKVDDVKKLIELGADVCHKDNEGKTVLDYYIHQDIGPHDKKDNPKFYQKKIKENMGKKLYKYLAQEYQTRCLE